MNRLLTILLAIGCLNASVHRALAADASGRLARGVRNPTSLDREAKPRRAALATDVVSQSGIAWHTTPEGAAKAASRGPQKPILWFRHVGELTGPMCSASHGMRVVSLDDPQVRRQVAARYVPLSTNMEMMPGAGHSVGHLPTDDPGMCPARLAHQNCQVYFLTPQLEMFHAATGFLPTEDLLREMQFAERLFAAMERGPGEARQAVIDAHRKYLQDQGFSERDLTPSAGGLERLLATTGMPFTLTGGSGKPGDIFGGISRSGILCDNQFLMEHPLISLADFERDPSELVGSGFFVFQSGPASGRPTGRWFGKD